MPRFVIEDPRGARRTLDFDAEIVIGRHPRSDLVLADPLVSRRHARVFPENGAWILEDLDSANGTFVNDRRIQRHALADGDRVRIGRTHLQFAAQSEEERLLSSVRLLADEEPPEFQESLEAEQASLFAPEAEVVDISALRTDYEKLRLGFALVERLSGRRELPEMLGEAAETLRKIFDADHCAILLAEGKARLVPRALAVRPGAKDELTVSQSVMREVLRTRNAVLLADAASDDRFREASSIVMQGMRSIMCAPILADGRPIGAVHLDSRRGVGAFTKRDLDLLAGIARHLALLVQNHRLIIDVEQETKLKAQFERLLSPSVAELVLAGKVRLDRGGELRDVTILFADIRDFTKLTAGMPATGVVALLNRYFEAVVGVIFEHQGTIDKYIGDEVMALFGAPVPLPDAADRAVACAVDIQQAVRRLNREQAARGAPPIQVGIGIGSGEVVVGSIGAEKTKQYTCIGEAVNIAARLTDMAGPGEILVSEDTWRRLERKEGLRPLPPTQIRGVEGTARVYAVEAIGEETTEERAPD